MKIRKAKIKDLRQIANLGLALLKYHRGFDRYCTPAKDARRNYFKFFKSCIYSPNKFLLVAEDNKKIIGYALGITVLRPPVLKLRRVGEVLDMFVLRKFRKKGVGELLIKGLFNWFKAKNIKYLELSVHVKNEAGKKAWRKFGFGDFALKLRQKLN